MSTHMHALIALGLSALWIFFFGYFVGLARGRKKQNDLHILVTHRHEPIEGEEWKNQ